MLQTGVTLPRKDRFGTVLMGRGGQYYERQTKRGGGREIEIDMRQVKDRDIKRDDGDIRRRVRIVYYYDFSAGKNICNSKEQKTKTNRGRW